MNLTDLIATPKMSNHVKNRDFNMLRRGEIDNRSLTRRTISEEDNCTKSAEIERVIAQREALLEDLRRLKEDNRTALTIATIEAALRSGRRLSKAELDFLRENNPELYEKAKKIEREREAYARELANARSKEDVARIHKRKAMQFAAEAKTVIKSNMSRTDKFEEMEFIFMRMAAVFNEHRSFVQSREYQELPDECDNKTIYVTAVYEGNDIVDPVQFLNDLFADTQSQYGGLIHEKSNTDNS
ncbi:MAG: hypothetical protein FWE29_00290 [Defluviitaleaceae bacterium]|nr:hypothetical protein [Defluviitaleaceae bacterium]